MAAKDLKKEEQIPLGVRISLYENQNYLETLIVKIPWDLHNGPEAIFDDPRGIEFPGDDILLRPDLRWPFASLCYIFRLEASPSQVVEFLLAFHESKKGIRVKP